MMRVTLLSREKNLKRNKKNEESMATVSQCKGTAQDKFRSNFEIALFWSTLEVPYAPHTELN